MLSIKVQELVLSEEKQDKAFCDTFVYEPENIQEKALGNLYIVGEVTNFSRGSSYLINLLVSIIKKEYYSNPKRTSLEALEAGLHRANSALSDFIEEGNDEWMGRLHMICASFKENMLHFSLTGDARVFLIRSGEMINLGKDLKSFNQKIHPLKTFANIASGSLEISDRLILATPELFRVTSSEIIEKTINQFTLSEAVIKFRELLETTGDVSAAGALLLEIAEREEETIETLPHIEIKPEETFQRQQSLKLKDIIGQASSKVIEEQTLEESQDEIQQEEYRISQTRKELILNKLSNLSGALKRFLNSLKGAGVRARQFIGANLFPVIKKGSQMSKEIYQSGKEKIRSTDLEKIKVPIINPKKIAKRFIEFPKTCKGLPKSSKVLLAGFLILIVLLFTSLVLLSQKRSQEIKFTHYSGILAQAHQKEDEAEAALIYQDEAKARNLLREARELTIQVLESKYLKKESQELARLIDKQVDKVDHIVRLTEISPLVDFREVNQDVKILEVEISGENLYSFDSSDNVIYKFNLETEKTKIAFADSSGLGHFKASVALKDNKIVFLTDTPGVALFDPVRETLKGQKITFKSDEKNFQDIASYSNNIYLLDSESKQIWKHLRILAGFSKGKAWIKPGEERPLDDAVSLAIDGAIWILKADGNILKYLTGYKKDFELAALINPLEQPTKIFTAPYLNNLYILDPNNRRALVFNKKGEIINQYVSDKFDNLKDLTVSKDEKKIYLLNGAEVFEVEM